MAGVIRSNLEFRWQLHDKGHYKLLAIPVIQHFKHCIACWVCLMLCQWVKGVGEFLLLYHILLTLLECFINYYTGTFQYSCVAK